MQKLSYRVKQSCDCENKLNSKAILCNLCILNKQQKAWLVASDSKHNNINMHNFFLKKMNTTSTLVLARWCCPLTILAVTSHHSVKLILPPKKRKLNKHLRQFSQKKNKSSLPLHKRRKASSRARRGRRHCSAHRSLREGSKRRRWKHSRALGELEWEG
jgi:hypothetical protein